jgi:hypothetical protein
MRRKHGDELVQFLLVFAAESLATSAPAELLLRQRLLLKYEAFLFMGRVGGRSRGLLM